MPVNGLVEIVELDDVKDRGEDFLFEDGHVGARADERGLDEVAEHTVAAKEDLASLILDAADAVQEVVDGAAVDQRTHEGIGIEGVADFHLTIGFGERSDNLRRDAALEEEAARGGAALAGGADGSEEDGAEDEIGICVVHHDDAVVAAELEDGAAKTASDDFGDVAADLG